MKNLLRIAALILSSVLALHAQPTPPATQTVTANSTSGLLGTPTTFFSNTTNATAIQNAIGFSGGILAGANGGTGVANTGKLITIGGNVTFAGAFGFTGNISGTTSVTFPTAGTLATLAGSEALTNKTYNGNTWTAGTGTLTLGAGKTTTFDHTSTFTTTDAQTYTFPTTSATLARTDAANTFTGTQTIATIGGAATTVSGNLTLSGTLLSGAGGLSPGLWTLGATLSNPPTFRGGIVFYDPSSGPNATGGFEFQNGQSGSGSGFKIFINNSTDLIGIAARNNSATWTSYFTIHQQDGVAAFLGTTEATTGGVAGLTTASGIYAAKKIISGSSTFDGAALAISGVNSVTAASGNNSLTLAGTGTGVEIFTLPARLPSYIVSGLPSASTAGTGAMAYVTDSVATAITGLGLAVVGSGGNKVMVVSDGTNWIVQ